MINNIESLWFFYGINGDEPIVDEDQYLELYHHYGEDYIIEHESFGQFMDEHDSEVSLKFLGRRFGTSFANLTHRIAQQSPDLVYQIQRNFEAEGIR